jgi:hypothetical protein
VKRDTALRLLALLALLAMLLAVTVMPGTSILDLTIDVGTKVFALYAAYIVWATLTVLLMNDSITQWNTREHTKAPMEDAICSARALPLVTEICSEPSGSASRLERFMMPASPHARRS